MSEHSRFVQTKFDSGDFDLYGIHGEKRQIIEYMRRKVLPKRNLPQTCLVHAHSLRDSDPPARSTRNTRVRKAYICHTHIYICFKLCMCVMFHRSPNERHTQPAPPPSPSKVLLDANFLLWISYDSMLVSIYYYFSLSVPQKEDGMLPKS